MPVAIVTGSDSGIGKACAVALASAVMDVGTGTSTPEATAGDTADHARLAE